MSDIWSGVQWWDEWQLRILVLVSLGFQWFLLLVIPIRNHTVQSWLRACIRLASICADVLAIYALATLLCRQAAGRWISGFDDGDYSRAQQVSSSLTLEALWAPLLLVHLGGREELTASGMDDGGDTALWVRHAVFLVTVTVYAFFTSLRYFSDSTDGGGFKMVASAALLLVAAVVSSCGKPWVLRRASVRRLVAKSSLAKGGRSTKTRCFAELGDRYKCWKELKPRGTTPMLSQGDKVQMLLSGMSLHAARATLETRKAKPDQEILEPLKHWRREQHEAALKPPKVDMIMKPWLRQAFGLAAVMFTPPYLACHALLVPSLYVAAAVLFFLSASHNKRGYSSRYYSRADVNTTYALLCFTAALDVFGMFVSEMVHSLLASASSSSCENLPGHNLMDSVLWTIRRPKLSMLLLRCYNGGSFGKDKDGLYDRVLDMIRNKMEDKDKDKDKNKDNKDKNKDGKDKDSKDKDKDKDNKDNKDKNKDDKDKDKDKFFDLDLSSYRSLSKRNWILRDEELKVVRGTNNVNNSTLHKKPSENLKVVRDTNGSNIQDSLDKKSSEDLEGIHGTNGNNIQESLDKKSSEDPEGIHGTNGNNVQDSLDNKSTKDLEGIPGTKDINIQDSLDNKSSEVLKVVHGTNKDDNNNNNNNIQDSLRKQPFDSSVLIWHIATDLCFRVKPPNYFRFRPPHDETVAREVCTEAISNYMAYLLDSFPEMLMAGSRQHLFTEAMANMEHIVGEATKVLRPKLREKQPLDGVILGRIREEADRLRVNEAYTVIDDACKLADQLLGIQDETSRWELMHRVWVGMLCYSAAMCRGELHAKSLGEGGEFLSSVWLLISLIGGRNLADKLQMPDDEEDPELEGKAKVGEAPARDNKEEQKAEQEAAAEKVQKPDSEAKNKLRATIFSRPGLGAGPRAGARG